MTDTATLTAVTRESPQALESAGDDSQWDLIIQPKRHLLDINFKDLWDYRDLLYMFVHRDIVTVYKQTILGPIWFFVQPPISYHQNIDYINALTRRHR